MKIYDYILCSGSGNRFLLFDTLRSDLSGLNIAAFAAEELHRFGVDGLLLLTRDGRGRFGMRMFNTDGSEEVSAAAASAAEVPAEVSDRDIG